MDKLNVCKVVGLEGFVNSGKSGVLKLLNKKLLNINDSKVLHVFDCCGNECATKDISYNDDIIVVVEVNGKKIVVVSGGDYLSTPDIVIEIINGLIWGINKISGVVNIPAIPEIPKVEIPMLATGAVIPPNAPFMAVLGDQKSGTNIEAPLDTIKQAVREVIGNGTSGGQYQFTAQINRRTLFDEFIDEARLRQNVSGRNPFDLGKGVMI